MFNKPDTDRLHPNDAGHPHGKDHHAAQGGEEAAALVAPTTNLALVTTLCFKRSSLYAAKRRQHT